MICVVISLGNFVFDRVMFGSVISSVYRVVFGSVISSVYRVVFGSVISSVYRVVFGSVISSVYRVMFGSVISSVYRVVLCRSLFVFSVVCVAQCLVFCSVDHYLFSMGFVLLNV